MTLIKLNIKDALIIILGSQFNQLLDIFRDHQEQQGNQDHLVLLGEGYVCYYVHVSVPACCYDALRIRIL